MKCITPAAIAAVAILLSAPRLPAAQPGGPATVTVKPQETQDILANPVVEGIDLYLGADYIDIVHIR